MSAPFTLDKLSAHPIMGIWSVEGHAPEFPGFLYLDGDNLQLTLYLSSTRSSSLRSRENDPNLRLFAPPNQPTLLGRTKAAGDVTLFHCAQLSCHAVNQVDPPITRLELNLRPVQAWIGTAFVSAKQNYKSLSFGAPGLHKMLSTIHVENVYLEGAAQEGREVELRKLTGAHEVYLVHRGEEPSAEVVKDGKPYKVRLSSSFSENHSSTDGVSIQTSDAVVIEAEGDGATLAELMNVSFELEQFIALLCIGPFRGKCLTVRSESHQSASLLWRLGRTGNSRDFSLVRHEILMALGTSPDLTKRAIEQWFRGSEAIRMARWLIFDSLFQEVSSTSKFLSIAQAWEVAGREVSSAAPYDKKTFKQVCLKVEEILQGALGPEPTLRLMQLLRSSNRESFGMLINNILSAAPPLALKRICNDVPEFVSIVVGVRNTLTHLQDGKKLSIERASYLSLFLTYKLIVLFCINTCISVGLPLDNLEEMLANNEMARTACRPLPPTQ